LELKNNGEFTEEMIEAEQMDKLKKSESNKRYELVLVLFAH
jgi:hypothetical protein